MLTQDYKRSIVTSAQKHLEFSVPCPSLSVPIWSHQNFSIQSACQAMGTCKPKQEQGKGVLQMCRSTKIPKACSHKGSTEFMREGILSSGMDQAHSSNTCYINLFSPHKYCFQIRKQRTEMLNHSFSGFWFSW